MLVLSSTTACRPWLPTKAAAGLTLRRPPLVVLDDHADRSPDSNPSEKIRSDGALVAMGVGVLVGAAAAGEGEISEYETTAVRIATAAFLMRDPSAFRFPLTTNLHFALVNRRRAEPQGTRDVPPRDALPE